MIQLQEQWLRWLRWPGHMWQVQGFLVGPRVPLAHAICCRPCLPKQLPNITDLPSSSAEVKALMSIACHEASWDGACCLCHLPYICTPPFLCAGLDNPECVKVREMAQALVKSALAQCNDNGDVHN